MTELSSIKAEMAAAEAAYDLACEEMDNLIASDSRHYNSSGKSKLDTPEAAAAKGKIDDAQKAISDIRDRAKEIGFKQNWKGEWLAA